MGALSYLVDTHVLLWWLFDDARLSRRARAALREPTHHVLVSSASAWEIATKHRLGKLDSAAPLVHNFSAWIAKAGFTELSIRSEHALQAGSWDVTHRDPFDRVLAAQSRIEHLPLVTRDPAFEQFSIDVLW